MTVDQPTPDFSRDELYGNFWNLYHRQIDRWSDNLAVRTKNYRLTFRELNRRANGIAAALNEPGGKRSIGVGLLLTDAPDIAPAFIGVMKAGHIVVYMDSAFPKSRLSYMLVDASVGLIITNNANYALAIDLIEDENRIINISQPELPGVSENPVINSNLDDVIQILFTSGSTGPPKGVIEDYRYLCRSIYDNISRYRVTHEDRYLGTHSFNFAGAHNSLFTCLFTGACYVHYPVDTDGLVGYKDFLLKAGITLFFSTPTIYRTFLTTLLPHDRFPGIRSVQLGGEKRLQQDFLSFQKHFPKNCIFTVTYATAETQVLTFNAFAHETQFDVNVLPSGYPEENIDLYIWDDNGKALQSGESGEIVVGGYAFAKGYLNKTSLTKEKFLPHPNDPNKKLYRTGDIGVVLKDGQLQHIGRLDEQVKINGVRVGLGSIENHLLSYPGIEQTAAKTVGDQYGNQKLAAYFVCARDKEVSVSDLRNFLSERLPHTHMPHFIFAINNMPLTGTRKIDKNALPEPTFKQPGLLSDACKSGDSLEKMLTLIWADILGLEQIGIHDNFFELGGDSLSVIRAVSQLNKKTGITLSVRDIFKSPTIAGMMEILDRPVS